MTSVLQSEPADGIKKKKTKNVSDPDCGNSHEGGRFSQALLCDETAV